MIRSLPIDGRRSVAEARDLAHRSVRGCASSADGPLARASFSSSALYVAWRVSTSVIGHSSSAVLLAAGSAPFGRSRSASGSPDFLGDESFQHPFTRYAPCRANTGRKYPRKRRSAGHLKTSFWILIFRCFLFGLSSQQGQRT